jgi:hypothetical protein
MRRPLFLQKTQHKMKKLLFILLAAGSVAVSSCDWWDYRDPWDPGDPPGGDDTIIDPWDPNDTNWWDPNDTTRDGDPPGGGNGTNDTIIIDDPWDPNDTSNWWGDRDTNRVGLPGSTR